MRRELAAAVGQRQKAEKQLDDIRSINRIKKWFLTEIKREYEEVVLGILNIAMKFAKDIKTQT